MAETPMTEWPNWALRQSHALLSKRNEYQKNHDEIQGEMQEIREELARRNAWLY